MGVIDLSKLSASEVPEQFSVGYYFDFEKHPFRHQALLESPEATSVVSVLGKIDSYAVTWLEETISAKEKEAKPKVLTLDDFKNKLSLREISLTLPLTIPFKTSQLVGILKFFSREGRLSSHTPEENTIENTPHILFEPFKAAIIERVQEICRFGSS